MGLINTYLIIRAVGWIFRFYGRCLWAPLDFANWWRNGRQFGDSRQANSVVGMGVRMVLCPIAWFILLAALSGACSAVIH